MMIGKVAVLCVLWVGFTVAKDPTCVRWGNTFDVSLESINVKRECTVLDQMMKKNKPICCAALGSNNQTGKNDDLRECLLIIIFRIQNYHAVLAIVTIRLLSVVRKLQFA